MADCTDNPITCFIASQVNILANVAQSMKPIEKLISGGAYLIGLAFAFKAIHSLRVYGESRSMMSSNTSIKEPLIYMLVAVVLVYIPTGVQVILNTTFGNTEYAKILSYGPISSSSSTLDILFGQDSMVGASLTIIIQTIGLIAFVRGWVLIAKSASQGQQPGGTGKGLMHVFGGILAMNIVATIQVINNTLYGSA